MEYENVCVIGSIFMNETNRFNRDTRKRNERRGVKRVDEVY